MDGKYTEPTKHIQWSEFRQMGSKQLRDLKQITAIYSKSSTIGVVIPYETYLRMRADYMRCMEFINTMSRGV